MKTRHAFVVDVNKCTGCDACTVACQIANQLPAEIQWREVRTFNELHVPAVEMIDLSMACNHCHDAPCMQQCPALAYHRDDETGAVLINAEACIGCGYCVWVCPYGAPRIDTDKGVMTKCNMCNDKVLAGGQPACVTSCPTGALDWRQLPDAELTQDVPGFADTGTDPSIRIDGVQSDRRVPEMTTPPSLPPWQRLRAQLPSQVTLAHEWTLAVFTLLAAILVGALTANQWGGATLDWRLFLGAGTMGMAMSASHLGQRLRAWRAPLHAHESWLSREIVLFSAFLGLGTLVLAVPSLPGWLGYANVALGGVALLAIDRVYGAAEIRGAGPVHSAHVLGTGLLLAAVGTGVELVVVTMALVKLVLFVARQSARGQLELAASTGLIVPRVGFLLAGVGWLLLGEAENSHLAAYAMIVAGEAIDRCTYYNELDIPTPNSRQFDELERRPEAQGIFAEN